MDQSIKENILDDRIYGRFCQRKDLPTQHPPHIISPTSLAQAEEKCTLQEPNEKGQASDFRQQDRRNNAALHALQQSPDPPLPPPTQRQR